MNEYGELFVFLLVGLPIIGAIICALLPRQGSAGGVALVISLAELAITGVLALGFEWMRKDASQPAQFGFAFGEIKSIQFNFHLALDPIAMWLVILTAFLMPLAIASSFASIRERQKEYYAWMLVLLAAMQGVFLSRDALLFYIFFELTLIPMFFIIGIWGGPERRYAAGKFFLFTFAGSVFTLAAIIYMAMRAGSFDLNVMIGFAQNSVLSGKDAGFTSSQRLWVALGFLAGFAVKVPLFPVHTWLPLAHTEAPTAGSVILAGVLLKLGTFGILRFVLPIGFYPGHRVMFPMLVQGVAWLCIVGIIYGALVAWVQQDIKKLVAYSSVSHLGFCVLGLVALNHEGVQGSILYMVNHGLSTGALFLVIGMIYDRYHTRDINELSGLARKMPILSFFFILFTLSSIGLPGLNGFVSEFLTILGAFRSEHLGIGFGALAALGIILGAVYMLHMAARVIWGPLKTPGHEDGHHSQTEHGQTAQTLEYTTPGTRHPEVLPADIGAREISILIPLAIAVVVLGVMPGVMLKTLEEPVRLLVGDPKSPVQTAVQPPEVVPLAGR